MKKLSLALLAGLAGLGACRPTLDVQVQVLDPCNQGGVVQGADYLKFIPRGEGIDSDAMTSVVDVPSGAAPDLKIPLASDFQLVVEGLRGDPESGQAVAIGVSSKLDLTAGGDAVTIRVPLAKVDTFYRTTELDDPTQCSSLNQARYGATATYLPDNGKVLIIGGANVGQSSLSYPGTMELYDPTTGTFTELGGPEGGISRAFHTATLLADGRVLVAGGEHAVRIPSPTGTGSRDAIESLRSAILIDARDPANVTTVPLAMNQARSGHVAALLADGRVLLAGGRILNTSSNAIADQAYLSSIELWDPADPEGKFVTAGDLREKRYGHSATLLMTGSDVVVAGGMGPGLVRGLEVVHVDGNQASATSVSSPLGVGPIFHAAHLAWNGDVLLAGGYDEVGSAFPTSGPPTNPSVNVELWTYQPSTGSLARRCGASMANGRGRHTVSTVGNKALFIGGLGADGSPLTSSEVVALSESSCFDGTPEVQVMQDARTDHAVADLESSGEVLVVGGRQNGSGPFGQSVTSAEVFSPLRNP